MHACMYVYKHINTGIFGPIRNYKGVLFCYEKEYRDAEDNVSYNDAKREGQQ